MIDILQSFSNFAPIIFGSDVKRFWLRNSDFKFLGTKVYMCFGRIYHLKSPNLSGRTSIWFADISSSLRPCPKPITFNYVLKGGLLDGRTMILKYLRRNEVISLIREDQNSCLTCIFNLKWMQRYVICAMNYVCPIHPMRVDITRQWMYTCALNRTDDELPILSHFILRLQNGHFSQEDFSQIWSGIYFKLLLKSFVKQGISHNDTNSQIFRIFPVVCKINVIFSEGKKRYIDWQRKVYVIIHRNTLRGKRSRDKDNKIWLIWWYEKEVYMYICVFFIDCNQ